MAWRYLAQSRCCIPASGQGVATGVVPHAPYMPPVLPRVGFSFNAAHRFSSNFANSRSPSFRKLFVYSEIFVYKRVPLGRDELA